MRAVVRTSSIMRPWSFIFCLNAGITFCVAHAATGEAASGEAASGEAGSGEVGSGEAGGFLGIEDRVWWSIGVISLAVIMVGSAVFVYWCTKYNEPKSGPKNESKRAPGSSNVLATVLDGIVAFGSKAGGKPQPINEVVIPMIPTKRGTTGP